jgi:uroporphyrinogen decarboxylase
MTFNMNEWAEHLKNNNRKLIFPLMTYPGLPLIGKEISDMVTSGEVQFRCIEALAKRYPQMAAIPMCMDLSLEAEAFGSKVVFSAQSVPTIAVRVIHNLADIEKLEIPEPSTDRINAFAKAAKLTVAANFGKPVFTGCIGPYSLAGRLMDITEIMTGILMYPDEIHHLLHKTSQFILRYLEMLKVTGVHGVVLAEPAAGLLAAEECEIFSSAYIRQLVEQVQDEHFMVILHNCGHTETLIDSMVGTGARAFHFGNAVKLSKILPQVPSNRLVFGNIDPAGVIQSGTPEQIEKAVDQLYDLSLQFPNFILSSGCDIPPEAPLENIDALFSSWAKCCDFHLST